MTPSLPQENTSGPFALLDPDHLGVYLIRALASYSLPAVSLVLAWPGWLPVTYLRPWLGWTDPPNGSSELGWVTLDPRRPLHTPFPVPFITQGRFY